MYLFLRKLALEFLLIERVVGIIIIIIIIIILIIIN